MTGAYAPFVLAAYALTGGALLTIVAWAVIDRASARGALERAERAAKQKTQRDAR
ncbi:MAG: heme exporter protein CcmD [Pseudomonadota bacterium]